MLTVINSEQIGSFVLHGMALYIRQQVTITGRSRISNFAAHHRLGKRSLNSAQPVNVGKLHRTCHSPVTCSTAALADIETVVSKIPHHLHHCLRIQLTVLEQITDLLLTLIWFRGWINDA